MRASFWAFLVAGFSQRCAFLKEGLQFSSIFAVHSDTAMSRQDKFSSFL